MAKSRTIPSDVEELRLQQTSNIRLLSDQILSVVAVNDENDDVAPRKQTTKAASSVTAKAAAAASPAREEEGERSESDDDSSAHYIESDSDNDNDEALKEAKKLPREEKIKDHIIDAARAAAAVAASNDISSGSEFQTTPPLLSSEFRYLPQPGAQRVAGINAAGLDTNEEDSAFFSITDQSNYPPSSATTTTLTNGSTKDDKSSTRRMSAIQVQAMLVEEMDEEAAQRRELELSEREAQIRERELELERKLAQIAGNPNVAAAASAASTPVVQAQIVAPVSPPTKLTKQKSSSKVGSSRLLGGLFKMGASIKKKTFGAASSTSPPISPTRTTTTMTYEISPTTSPKHVLPSLSPAGSVVNDSESSSSDEDHNMVSKPSGGKLVSPSSSDYHKKRPKRTTSSSSSSWFRDDIHTVLPIFKHDEVVDGKNIVKWKHSVVSRLESIKLHNDGDNGDNDNETTSRSWRKNTQQIELRNQAASTFCSKRRGAIRYCVKRIRSYDESGRQDAAAFRHARRHDAEILRLAHESSLLMSFHHDHIMKLSGISEGVLSVGRTRQVPQPSYGADKQQQQQQQQSGGYFAITEMVEKSLVDFLLKSWIRSKTRGPQQFLDRLEVATNLASVLSYLHSKNIVYFDLKPENVGFDANGVLKLYKFGAAYKLKGCKTPSYDAEAVTRTPFAGMLPYASPEAALKQPSGLRSDVYGFSIILWEIMTLKQEPYPGLLVHEYTRKVIQEQMRPKLGKKIPTELSDIMSAGWQHEPSRRPCMKEIHERLFRFQEEYRTKHNYYR